MRKPLCRTVLFLFCLAAFLGCGGSGGGGSGGDSSTAPPVPDTPVPSDTWRTMAQNPLWSETFYPRYFSLVWTGSEMILWGPLSGTTLMTGALYDPLSDTWSPISTQNAPYAGTAIWSGEEMIVFTGNGTGAYNPTTNSWRVGSVINQPEINSFMSVWTGTEMLVWGINLFNQSAGGKYTPNTDTWSAISGAGAPRPSRGASMVWTGSRMIVWTGWGGAGWGGAAYDPTTDIWTPLSYTNIPSPSFNHLAVWTGDEMIIWGGQIQVSSYIIPVSNGRRYNPLTDFWSSISSTGSLWAIQGDAAVWTGTEMLLWSTRGSGVPGAVTEPTRGGAAYNPGTDTWRAISSVNAPTTSGPAVWTGTEMIVWSGLEGGRYTP